MSIFGPIHLQHWCPTYQNLDIYILDVKSNVNIRADPFATLVPKLPKSEYIYILDVTSNVNIRTDPFATLVPKLPKSIYIYTLDVKSNVNIRTGPCATLAPKLPKIWIYMFWMLNPMSVFGPIYLQHRYPNYPNLDIYILDAKSNVSIRTDPFATLVPKLPKSGYIYSGC
jgi:hypothetical protein